MPELSGIYDSAQIQPIARIKDNLSIWTRGHWEHFVIEFQEPLPPGPASIVDMVLLAGLANLPANGTIQKLQVPILVPSDYEFLQLRFEPLDFVEGVLWELSGVLRFNSQALSARVDPFTRLWDPTLASTAFWVMGASRNISLEVRNPLPVALPAARFLFFGYRMLLEPHPGLISTPQRPIAKDILDKLEKGDPATVRQYVGATTWLPAQGR